MQRKASKANLLPQKVRLELLFDFYGSLLTDKQQRALELHWDEDFSLREVAEHLSVSRQAVYYAVRSAQTALEHYEEKLGLVAQFEQQRAQISELLQRLSQIESSVSDTRAQQEIRAIGELLRAITES